MNSTGLCQIIADILKADTGTLYGASRYLQAIEHDQAKFPEAAINLKIPYGLFISCSGDAPLEIMARIEYEQNNFDLRFEAISLDVASIYVNFSNAWKRIKLLINNQMWSGLQCTQYYTDSLNRIYDIEPSSGNLPAPVKSDNGNYIIEFQGAITMKLTRKI